jgi:hypothetical protein
MNSSKLCFFPSDEATSRCKICYKDVSNLLLLAHKLTHKEDSILSKSSEIFQSKQDRQQSGPAEQAVLTSAQVSLSSEPAAVEQQQATLPPNQVPTKRDRVSRSIKIASGCHARLFRINLTYKRCIRLHHIRTFRRWKKQFMKN